MSLSGYISEINSRIHTLQKRIEDLEQENRELKDFLTTSNHRWWMNATQKKTTDDYVEDLIQMSNQPDFLKYR